MAVSRKKIRPRNSSTSSSRSCRLMSRRLRSSSAKMSTRRRRAISSHPQLKWYVDILILYRRRPSYTVLSFKFTANLVVVCQNAFSTRVLACSSYSIGALLSSQSLMGIVLTKYRVPICKDDLVCLPIQMAKQNGNISPIVLCHRYVPILSLQLSGD